MSTSAEAKTHVTQSDNVVSKARKYLITPKLLMCKMAHVLREVVLICLMLLVYSSLSKQPPKVSKAPAAYPFFSRESVTVDFYRGQLTQAIEYARESDVSFVMYYAPWDAESQMVRSEFEKAAKDMQGRVAFTAINCWQPQGQCRRRYNRIYTWPILIAYPAHGKGIQYYGPKSAPHMLRFLYGVMEPLVRVTDRDGLDLKELQVKFDTVILVKVAANPGNKDYITTYNTALRLLQKFPHQDTIVAVQTVQKTADYKPEMSLHSWNGTLFYPYDGQWKVEDLVSWSLSNLEQVTMWLTPQGTKSTGMLTYIQGHATMLLFTPRNPLIETVDYYQMYRQVAMKYYNCGISNGLTDELMYFNRLDAYANYKNQVKTCLLNIEKEQQSFKGSITLSNSKILANSSFCKSAIETECSNCKEFCSLNYQVAKCGASPKMTSMLTENDTKSPVNLKKLLSSFNCAKLSKAINYEPLIFSQSVTNMKYPSNLVEITGLSCNTNSTLTMIAIDSLLYHQFADRLGVDIRNETQKTAVIIINEKEETHHVMTGILSEERIEQFIHNFTFNLLPRARLSTKITNKPYKAGSVSVQDLNSDNFLEVVLEENKSVIVLFHTRHCAYCSALAHIYLTLAHTMRHCVSLSFARIDADAETLPWAYTMPALPTVLVLPANRKAESRVFPIGRDAIGVASLTAFVLRNVEGVGKVEAWWSVCVNTKHGFDSSECFVQLRLEVLSLTEATLRQWRLSTLRAKSFVLRKLQNLKQLHLLLAYTPKDITAIRNHFTLYIHR